MSVISRIQMVLNYEYDPHVGFTGLTGGAPCIRCLASMHRDVNELVCVAGHHVAKCVVCQIDKKKCSAVPQELYGAAQYTWNMLMFYRQKEADGELSDLDRGRILVTFAACASAWERIGDYIANPSVGGRKVHLEQATLQELASNREHMALMIQVQTGLLDANNKDEIQNRLSALQPAYLRNDSRAHALQSAMDSLETCDIETKPGVTIKSIADFPQFEKFRKLVGKYSANNVPTCVVAVYGAGPIGRGQSTQTPSKRRALATTRVPGGPDSEASESEESERENSPSKLRAKRRKVGEDSATRSAVDTLQALHPDF
ncbi:hypothetical protein CSUB01_08322 [Colletotrichum sublineola]|uniref:Uncharacterized protein n=1 Tax=Colletotrichum sublineola TaxID=1173701 RepID=A0A066XY41_COLSU|nr:hypothetical protein CSUB01_08322 [Colletotrichum sublineola]